MLRIQIPQSAIPAIQASSCKYAEIRLNEANEVRFKNFNPNLHLPPAPECAEMRIEKADAVEFYEFLLSVKEGATYGDLGKYKESYLLLEKNLRPFCSLQLEWLDDGEGMQQIWGAGWMVTYRPYANSDRVDMCLTDHEGGSQSFAHGDHREAYQKVAHLGIKALKKVHYAIPVNIPKV